MFSPSQYSEMLVSLPGDLLHYESVRLSNEMVKETRIPYPQGMLDLMDLKIQLIDLEILRRDKLTGIELENCTN